MKAAAQEGVSAMICSARTAACEVLPCNNATSGEPKPCLGVRRIVLQDTLETLFRVLDESFIQATVRKEHQQRGVVGRVLQGEAKRVEVLGHAADSSVRWMRWQGNFTSPGDMTPLWQ
jgi:hypothetical protein